jgi:NADH-quinone oxidoreductase subunit L
LAGVFPFVGFWSKELIFEALWHGGQYIIFFVAFITAILTAFYTFRMVGITFFGEKSEHIKSLESHGHRIHEAPPTMTIPLIILAVLAATGGILELVFFGYFSGLETGALTHFDWTHLAPFALGITTVFTIAVWLVGITPAYLIYWRNKYDLSRFKDGFLYKFLWNRWYINALWYRIFVDGYLWLSNAIHARVESVLLAFSGALSGGLDGVSRGWRRTMTGVLNTNVLGMMVGIIAFLLILIFL